jgi:hypothetical protein
MGNSASGKSDGPAAAPPMPLFYRQPELLSPERHAGKSLSRTINFSFARGTNSVPLNGVEFASAQRHYPIVFTPGEPALPVTVLGLRDEENRFVDPDGRWQPGYYIPAYIRRYPFVFMTTSGEESFTLCIDVASEFVTDGVDNPLFAKGQPTETTKNALGFCAAFQAEFVKTREFCSALAEHKLLDVRSADINLADGRKFMFGAFRVISEERFKALADDVILAWHKRGWLAWIHAHFMSFASWGSLTG